MKLIDLTGRKIGGWTVVRRHRENYRRTFAQWQCVCQCGTQRIVLANSLLTGKSKSCGCLKDTATSIRMTIHGHARRTQRTPTYTVWKGMHQRCTNPKSSVYKYYGGRGISVCARWDNFENFLADMGERPKGLSIDRIDNDGDYQPKNCRWATQSMQVSNRRNLKAEKGKGARK